jgi:hypothetical protein
MPLVPLFILAAAGFGLLFVDTGQREDLWPACIADI